jgi:hypothetical protein
MQKTTNKNQMANINKKIKKINRNQRTKNKTQNKKHGTFVHC